MHYMNAVWILLSELVRDPTRPIWRIVVHDQNPQARQAEGQQFPDHGRQVLGLVIRRNDHHHLRSIH
jgi:hypothetical protein